jgi:hypothetical protein
MSRSFVTRAASSIVLSAAILSMWTCTEETVAPVDRETFIQVYLELRVAALDSEDASIVQVDRERILEKYGITAEDMVAFADAHGSDVDYMRDLWNEIEIRLDVDSLSAP